MTTSVSSFVGIISIVLGVTYASQASALTLEQCTSLLQKNKKQLAATGSSENEFLIQCLQDKTLGEIAVKRQPVPSEGSVVSPPKGVLGTPNTVGGIISMPR